MKLVEATQNQTSFSVLREGFITNVMNPKATLFFLSVFTQVIDSQTSLVTQLGYGCMMAMIVGTWFCILTRIINFSPVRKRISSVQYYLGKVM